MHTLKAILRNAASLMLAGLGLLLLFVVVVNVLDWEWSRRAKKGFVTTGYAETVTMPSNADTTIAPVPSPDSLPSTK